jgi:nitroimidazol reductase NimA-like FMN-containing flavoprotein (pyridoxamine 5'-phosphate oxidase superfamily)
MYGELSGTQIEHLFKREVVAHLGCYGGGKPYVVPINFAYDGAHIYGYTRDGMKLRLMRAHPTVCVQVDHISGITEWESVIAWGLFEELHGDEALAARRLIEDRFAPQLGGTPIERAHGMGGWGSHPSTWQDAMLYRITLTTKSGRFERP